MTTPSIQALETAIIAAVTVKNQEIAALRAQVAGLLKVAKALRLACDPIIPHDGCRCHTTKACYSCAWFQAQRDMDAALAEAAR